MVQTEAIRDFVLKKCKQLPLSQILLEDTSSFFSALENRMHHLSSPRVHSFFEAVFSLPEQVDSTFENGDIVSVLSAGIANPDLVDIQNACRNLMPWRKGPFSLFDIQIDAEWRCDLKWNRLKDHLPEMTGQMVLDIGCGSGYYMFRMASGDPKCVVGIDPTWQFFAQFHAIQTYAMQSAIGCLPVGWQELSFFKPCFNTVFCMGILYHHPSPLSLLESIYNVMPKGGTLFLETLIAPGDDLTAFFPEKRYANMKNVYFLPTSRLLSVWLSKTKFSSIEVLDVSETTENEQRVTAWSSQKSLIDAIDPSTPSLTVEGHFRPIRGLLKAKKL